MVKQRHFTEVLKYGIWNSHSDAAEHSNLLQCDTVLLGEQFPHYSPNNTERNTNYKVNLYLHNYFSS